ncbi:MAG: outer membrane lipid asymmetry maintenance protein MlaD [Alphaproteobacteria bacterium]
MRHNVIEAVIGAVVLAVAAIFVVFAYSSAGISTPAGYPLLARFERIDGVGVGTDVRVSGIKVGTVTGLVLDPKTYLAEVRMSIDPTVRLPTDTVAAVSSSGLLGDKFLGLVPGGEEKTIEPGGVIKYTQASVSIEELLGKFMFSQGGADKKEGPGSDKAPSDRKE